MQDKTSLSITVVMPALNEERNIKAAMRNTLLAFDDFGLTGELIVVNDGSTDRTEDLAREIMALDKRARIIRHQRPMGIGASFWDGVDNANCEIVTMFPGDNENDPWESLRNVSLLDHVDMVIPFVFNKETRSLFRNALSFLYRFIINTTFLVNFNYTNGTVLYRRSLLKELTHRSNGFFYQTDILVRMVKRGYLFAEVPYRLGARSTGVSKAVTIPSLMNVMKGYINLVRGIYFTEGAKEKRKAGLSALSKDSMTVKRHTDKSHMETSEGKKDV